MRRHCPPSAATRLDRAPFAVCWLGNWTRSNEANLAADVLAERLHRARASCGFCGALALAAHAAQLQDTLRAGNRFTGAQRDAFVAVCRETAAALRG